MYTIVSASFTVVTLIILIRYIILNKKYPNSLKVFSISVIVYTIFSFMCSIVEVIIYFSIKNYFTTHRLILYCMFAFLHFVIVLFLYFITSPRFVLLKEFFYHYDFFWVRHKVRYDRVIKYINDIESGNLYLYTDECKIKIPQYMENQLEILKYLKMEK